MRNIRGLEQEIFLNINAISYLRILTLITYVLCFIGLHVQS